MQKEDFISFAQKYAQNKCSLSEKEAVEIFFQKRIEEEENTTILFSEEKRKVILDRINAKISKPKGVLRALYFKTATIAAIGIALIGMVFLFNPGQNHRTIIQSTAKGEQKTLLLPDGSQILLNANSSLSYSSDFKTNRNIILSGEAYFKVVKNPNRPFIVKSEQFETKVVGTSFTIKAYKNQSNQIKVLTGIVEVNSTENTYWKFILTKNQQLKFSKSMLPVQSFATNEDFLAWTKNTLIFTNSTLGEAAETLENKFNVSIIFDSHDLRELRITGKFKKENLNNILQSIAVVKQLEIEFITQNQIYIREKNKNDIQN
ncbi:ferric-dicitrate binding protein FerR (iron transport regulator) [Flavobacterium sp. CG_9.1]|uniref:FecR family protein n=1 Tax=Flavobacterium sp. CG_9.1 TaxID=2787728 RepID=UPI0018CBDBA1|nr:FecR domain-containing protein [Flavobacterium sp. CG_9.1]MBG6062994.1 ferric-dicitrate binding protein FerR (iron transport regulator) [Flavobacterium sp. CG_9.1]